MGRARRILVENGVYHVFNRGISRKPIHFSEYHAHLFFYLLDIISERYNLEIYAYCLMKNHFHLLLKTKEPNLDKAMQYFLSLYARKINQEINGDGALFRGRYRSILVDSTRYLLQVSRYIHLNPVEAGFVSSPEDYELSSYTAYTKAHHHSFLNTKPVLSHFSEKEELIEYTNLGVDKPLKRFYQLKRHADRLDLETI